MRQCRRVSAPIRLAILLSGLALGLLEGCAPDSPRPDAPTKLPAGHSAGTSRAPAPFRGVALYIERGDRLADYFRCIDHIADGGYNAVEFFVNTHEDRGKSIELYLDFRYTPSPVELGKLIDHARQRGLRTLLVPQVVIDTEEDVPGPHPHDWDKWFDHYREIVCNFAWVAQEHHVDVLAVGYDLGDAEFKRDRWVQLIQSTRDFYRGPLTYIARADRYQFITFWRQLDAITICDFAESAMPDKAEAQSVKLQAELGRMVTRSGESIFLEAGLRSSGSADATASSGATAEAHRQMIEKIWKDDPNYAGCIAGRCDDNPPTTPR